VLDLAYGSVDGSEPGRGWIRTTGCVPNGIKIA
jgi:hypothetical protein